MLEMSEVSIGQKENIPLFLFYPSEVPILLQVLQNLPNSWLINHNLLCKKFQNYLFNGFYFTIT